MRKRKTSAIGAAGTYVAVIIGAGFASGQEIMSYFVDYGNMGFVGMLVSSLLFGLTGWAIWDICIHERIVGYKHFIDTVMGKKFGVVIEIALGMFMFIVFSAMLAAAGASINESFHLPFFAGVFIAATLCFIAFLFNMSGIVKLNAVLAPVMILGCIFIGLYTFFNGSTQTFAPIKATAGLLKKNWLFSAITYTCYNIITAVTILSSMGEIVRTRKDAFVCGLFSAIILALLGLSLALSLNLNYDVVRGFEIPLLALVSRYSVIIKYLYVIIFLTAVFTTAATNGFSAIEWINTRYHINKFALCLVITGLGTLAAYGGFSNLVANVYPLFAIAGFVEIYFILKHFIKGKIFK